MMKASVTASPTGQPGYTQTMPCAPESAADARALVRIALAVWRLDELAEDGTLVVSELVGNAARHTRSRLIRVTATRVAPCTVRIGVVDASRLFPVPRNATEEDLGGRGLAVVEALACRWGTDRLPWGKRVWAELGRTRGG